MTDLVEFIEARLAEDMALALLASPGPWYLNAEHDEVMAVDDISVADVFALSNNQLRNTAAFIACHDPARVLREVEAKRALLAACVEYDDYPAGMSGSGLAYRVEELLALPYADHPDYRQEEWAP